MTDLEFLISGLLKNPVTVDKSRQLWRVREYIPLYAANDYEKKAPTFAIVVLQTPKLRSFGERILTLSLDFEEAEEITDMTNGEGRKFRLYTPSKTIIVVIPVSEIETSLAA